MRYDEYNDGYRMGDELRARLRDAVEQEWGPGDPYDGPNATRDDDAYGRNVRAIRATPDGYIAHSEDDQSEWADDEDALNDAQRVVSLIAYFGLEDFA